MPMGCLVQDSGSSGRRTGVGKEGLVPGAVFAIRQLEM